MATGTTENAVDEDAADLVFPPEFEKVDTKTLLISEVHILLEHRKQVRGTIAVKGALFWQRCNKSFCTWEGLVL